MAVRGSGTSATTERSPDRSRSTDEVLKQLRSLYPDGPSGPSGAVQEDDALPGAVLAQWEHRQHLRRILGTPFFQSVTDLPLPGGGTLGPLYVDGRPVSWTLWAPHRRVLVDDFRRGVPPQGELDARAAFATTYGLRYGMIEPGRRLTLNALEEWVTTWEPPS